jgi:hypothetical protein
MIANQTFMHPLIIQLILNKTIISKYYLHFRMTCQRCSNVKCNTCPGDKCDSCINKLNNPGSFNQYEFFYENDCY